MTCLSYLQSSSEADEVVAVSFLRVEVSFLREEKDREEWEQHMGMAISMWYQMYGCMDAQLCCFSN